MSKINRKDEGKRNNEPVIGEDDEILRDIKGMVEDIQKSIVFVGHIKRHLRKMKIDGKVQCKICKKDIDEIYEQEK